MKKLKTQIEIYEEVKNFIENHADKKTLTNMLVQAIDNHGYEVADCLHDNYKKEMNARAKNQHHEKHSPIKAVYEDKAHD